MRREVSSQENITVQATSFVGKSALFDSGLGGNFLDNLLADPPSRYAVWGRSFFSLHMMGSKEI